MNVELKPCPFCGNKEPSIMSAVGESWVLCETCKATTEAHTSRQRAIDSWNRRADERYLPEMGFIRVLEEIRPALIQEMESKSAKDANYVPQEISNLCVGQKMFDKLMSEIVVRVPTGRTIRGMVHTQRILKDGWYLVELENGTHIKSAPEEVTFIDSKGRFDEICWEVRA